MHLRSSLKNLVISYSSDCDSKVFINHCSHTPYTHSSHTACSPSLHSPCPPRRPLPVVSAEPAAPDKHKSPQNSSLCSAHTSNSTTSRTPASSTSQSSSCPRSLPLIASRTTPLRSLRVRSTNRRCTLSERGLFGRWARGFRAFSCRRWRRFGRRASCWCSRGGCLRCRRSRLGVVFCCARSGLGALWASARLRLSRASCRQKGLPAGRWACRASRLK
jgi:hypothetical protein